MRLKYESDAKGVPTPESGTSHHWDDELKGFGLRITAKGVRSFVAQARVNGRTRRVTIGRHGPWKVEQARKRAQKLLGEMADGLDPVAEKKRQKAESLTLAEVAEDYIANKRRKSDGKPLAERTKTDIRKHLNGNFADWRNKPLTAIDRTMVSKRYATIANRSLAQANQAMRVLSALYNYARGLHKTADGEHVITDNPVHVIREAALHRGEPQGRDNRVPFESLGAFYAALEATRTDPATGPGIRTKAAAAVVLLLTGLRLGDVTKRQWGDVDLEAGSLYVPDSKHRQPRTFPLARQAVQAIQDLAELTGASPYIFAKANLDGPVGDIRQGMQPALNAIDHHVTAHDLRRTFDDLFDALEIDPIVGELLSNRTPQGVRFKHYANVGDLTRYRNQAQRIADFLEEKRLAAESENVVALEAAR
jgi:integrase